MGRVSKYKKVKASSTSFGQLDAAARGRGKVGRKSKRSKAQVRERREGESR